VDGIFVIGEEETEKKKTLKKKYSLYENKNNERKY
jgi:hypothetical protein